MDCEQPWNKKCMKKEVPCNEDHQSHMGRKSHGRLVCDCVTSGASKVFVA